MATVQSYTKTGVDNKMASRSNVTLTYSGTGTPELSAFPDAKTGDIIERSSDRAQWRVLGNTLVSLGHIVTKVNGLTGEVNITAAGLNASPTGHKHTIADITDLTVSTTATANHVVKRITGGNITVPTTPNANTSAASKSYVDSQVSTKANSSHTHTKSQITDLETISTTATDNHIVKRTTGGNITVPTTPNASGSATSKSYVDTEVGKKANTSHTHTSADISDTTGYFGSEISANRVVRTGEDGHLHSSRHPTSGNHLARKSYVDTEVGTKANTSHTHTISHITDLTVSTTATANHVVKRITGGNITVPTTPNASGSATSKSYVDTEVGKKANTSHAHGISDVSGLQEALNSAGSSVHTHVSADVTDAVYGDVTTSPQRLVKTDVDGYLRAPAAPTAVEHAASKGYVDTEVGKKANTSHTHTIAQITDLTVSKTATVNHVVQRTTSGNITVPTTPNANTSAASKSYVDTEVGKKANTSHTHTKSQITDLETVSTGATGNHIVKRNTDGNITVPATPAATTSATSKSYVDTEVGKKANTSHTHTKSQITDLETISTSATANHVVKRITSGNITVPTTPNASTSATSKSYVDGEVGKKANTSHTHKLTDFPMTDRTNWINSDQHPGKLVYTRPDGYLHGGNPTASSHVAIKGYVDDSVSPKLDSSEATVLIGPSSHGKVVRRESDSDNIRAGGIPIERYHAAAKGYVDAQVANAMPWSGTRTQYNAITTKDPNRLYIITGA